MEGDITHEEAIMIRSGTEDLVFEDDLLESGIIEGATKLDVILLSFRRAMTPELINDRFVKVQIGGSHRFKTNGGNVIAVHNSHVAECDLTETDGVVTRHSCGTVGTLEGAIIKGDLLHDTELESSIRLEFTASEGDIIEGKILENDVHTTVESTTDEMDIVERGVIKHHRLAIKGAKLTILELDTLPSCLCEVGGLLVIILKNTTVKHGITDRSTSESPCVLLVGKLMVLNTQIVIIPLDNTGMIGHSLTSIPKNICAHEGDQGGQEEEETGGHGGGEIGDDDEKALDKSANNEAKDNDTRNWSVAYERCASSGNGRCTRAFVNESTWVRSLCTSREADRGALTAYTDVRKEGRARAARRGPRRATHVGATVRRLCMKRDRNLFPFGLVTFLTFLPPVSLANYMRFRPMEAVTLPFLHRVDAPCLADTCFQSCVRVRRTMFGPLFADTPCRAQPGMPNDLFVCAVYDTWRIAVRLRRIHRTFPP